MEVTRSRVPRGNLGKAVANPSKDAEMSRRAGEVAQVIPKLPWVSWTRWRFVPTAYQPPQPMPQQGQGGR